MHLFFLAWLGHRSLWKVGSAEEPREWRKIVKSSVPQEKKEEVPPDPPSPKKHKSPKKKHKKTTSGM